MHAYYLKFAGLKFLPAVLAGCFIFTSPVSARTWTSVDGSKTFEGEWVAYDSDSGAVSVQLANAKFVLVTLGEAKKGSGGNGGKILEAHLAVDGAEGKYPEFKGNVATVYTNPLSNGGVGIVTTTAMQALT
jgi:hypothetical protein